MRRRTGLALLAPFWWQERTWLRVAGGALRPFLPGSFRPFRRANFANPQFRHAIAGFMPGLDLEDPQVQQAVREIPIPLSLIEQVLEIGQDAYRAAPQITAPTLVVQGARDEVVRASPDAEAAGALRRASAISGGAGRARPDRAVQRGLA